MHDNTTDPKEIAAGLTHDERALVLRLASGHVRSHETRRPIVNSLQAKLVAYRYKGKVFLTRTTGREVAAILTDNNSND